MRTPVLHRGCSAQVSPARRNDRPGAWDSWPSRCDRQSRRAEVLAPAQAAIQLLYATVLLQLWAMIPSDWKSMCFEIVVEWQPRHPDCSRICGNHFGALPHSATLALDDLLSSRAAVSPLQSLLKTSERSTCHPRPQLHSDLGAVSSFGFSLCSCALSPDFHPSHKLLSPRISTCVLDLDLRPVAWGQSFLFFVFLSNCATRITI